MAKIGLKKGLKHLYLPSAKQPVIVDVPPMNFLTVDGVVAKGGMPVESHASRLPVGR